MDSILFILDRAHGKNVKGKASPDGTFKEWKYSQKVVDDFAEGLAKLNIPFAFTVEEDIEPGRVERVKRANKLSEGVEHPIFVSLHNNAAPKSIQGQARGNEVFVKRQPGDKEQLVGDTFAKNLRDDFPEMSFRQYKPGVLYKEANFTVLAGYKSIEPNYTGVLLEFGFMDNDSDLALLRDDDIFKRYIDSLLYSAVELCDHYNYGNFITPEK